MRKPQGFSFAIDLDGKVADEADTFQCGHCQRIVIVPPKASMDRLGGNCTICQRLVCPKCVKTGRCDPFEEKIQRVERTQDVRRWICEATR